MKRIFIGFAFVAGFFSLAQEAGKAGELLKNEANKTEMQTQKSQIPAKKNGNLDNSGLRKQNQNRNNENGQRRRNPNYNWNQNYSYGYAEVFVRIPEQGYYTVEIGDQMSSNASGKYRFFDLTPGLIPVSIYDNGYLVYRTRVNVRNNSRLVLDFFSNEGLYLLGTYPLQDDYGNAWNDLWNSPYGGNSGQWDPFHENNQEHSYGNNQGNSYGNVMSNNMFNSFLNALQNTKFDDDRVSVIKQQLATNRITSEQVKALMKSLTFDENRLNVAKFAYSRCVDRNNYFMIYSAFEFESYAQELRDYISRN